MNNIFNKGVVKNGILRANLESFNEFFQFTQFFSNSFSDYYFRGQANANWKLTTTLERFETDLHKEVNGTARFILNDFKRLVRGKGLLSNVGLSSDAEFFALGQHYGLPTPLLDWSESIYIALFFAFADKIPDDVESVAIWAIQKSAKEIMEDFNQTNSSSIEFPLQFIDPFTDTNSRLLSQAGIFLQKPSNICIEEVVEKYCFNNNRSPVMAKITFPAKERLCVLNNLNAMNINWSTIYPGIEGAALHAKMKLELLNNKILHMSGEQLFIHANQDIRK